MLNGKVVTLIASTCTRCISDTPLAARFRRAPVVKTVPGLRRTR